jgi:hypothetical protein
MISAGPDTPAPGENAIHSARKADREAADAGGQGACIIRLREEVDVIGLHSELDDAEVGTRRRREGPTHGRENAVGAQAVKSIDRPQRHVHGVRRGMRRAGAVRDAGPAAGRRLAAGTGPPATPRAGRGQRELA